MSDAKETCPTCGKALRGLACSTCGVTWVRCSCGRGHAPRVKECPHCHATVPLGYLAELVSKELIDSPKQLRSVIARERIRYIEARHAKPSSNEPTVTEISLMPASPDEQLPREDNVQRSRVGEHNGQIKEQNRRVARRSIRDVQSSQSERLNPYWL
jgi:DNA primase large subunit